MNFTGSGNPLVTTRVLCLPPTATTLKTSYDLLHLSYRIQNHSIILYNQRLSYIENKMSSGSLGKILVAFFPISQDLLHPCVKFSMSAFDVWFMSIK